MKKISEVLKQKGIKSDSLPQEIKDEIAKFKQDVKEYNEMIEEYEKEQKEENEPDEELEKKLDDAQDALAERELAIADKIINYNPNPEPAPAPAPAPASAPEPAKKEDSSVGWLVFGGVVLALTLGAVNLMKKR